MDEEWEGGSISVNESIYNQLSISNNLFDLCSEEMQKIHLTKYLYILEVYCIEFNSTVPVIL